MPTAAIMPNVSGTTTEAKITQWLKKEGDAVKEGEPLFIIETEKVTVDVDAIASGTLHRIIVREGVTVPVTEPVAIIAAPGDSPADIESFIAKMKPQRPPAQLLKTDVPSVSRTETTQVRASPSARRLARELGVDLTKVRPMGNIIVEKDVTQAAAQMTAIAAASGIKVAKTLLLEGTRKVTADRMTESVQHIPQLTLVREADITEAYKQIEKLCASGDGLPSLIESFMLIKATAKALKDTPILNSALNKDRIEIFETINIGIAVATNQGLVVPVLKDVDKKPFNQIATEVERLILKAMRGKLAIEEVMGATFTITNMGSYGVSAFTPIINPPQAAILGVGQSEDRPAVIENKVGIRRILPLSLTFDHRITDGAPAATFLEGVVNYLNSPKIID
jgi:pyruvate dehydrogenase E2 component (dihydrolipoamide acetyltransferase)